MTIKDTIKSIRRRSRLLFKDMKGVQVYGSRKGKRGYTRKIKHKKSKEDQQDAH